MITGAELPYRADAQARGGEGLKEAGQGLMVETDPAADFEPSPEPRSAHPVLP